MTLNQLNYFLKIAELGNMGQAAKVLHVAQPSLSVAIANLEKELNISLFNRTGHHLTLSSNGAQFLIHAKKILDEVQEAQLHMQSLASDQATQIHIGCIAPVLFDYLPLAIHTFMDIPENHNVKVDFVTDNTHILLPKLHTGYFDFLICSKTDDKNVVQTTLIEEPFKLLCPPDFPIPQTWDELLEQKLIGFHVKAVAHHEIHTALLREGIQPNYLHRAPDEESIACLVSHGFGYGIVPLCDSIKGHKIQIADLPPTKYPLIRKIYLTLEAGSAPVGAAKRFIKFLHQYNKERSLNQ